LCVNKLLLSDNFKYTLAMRFKNKSTDITILQLGVWCATSINVCEASVSRRNFMEMQSINFFRLLNLLCWFFLFDLANHANDYLKDDDEPRGGKQQENRKKQVS